ncbi:hypothetical protein AN189_07410 [Loktanella sp. 3ANDIMAR09]|uniref:hypothetical protein n=1 Tax=Loktanella sp. 3ANDIMAR09 TaxID=1225657 RepID=UPI0006F6FAAA|nr:hypothetical protein [Loktanella sp. 3ANDIMAR09]KQI68718.1 hypothetical protein AN189_07410 [Loktanella sp. 3ANDIMAR09]
MLISRFANIRDQDLLPWSPPRRGRIRGAIKEAFYAVAFVVVVMSLVWVLADVAWTYLVFCEPCEAR